MFQYLVLQVVGRVLQMAIGYLTKNYQQLLKKVQQYGSYTWPNPSMLFPLSVAAI